MQITGLVFLGTRTPAADAMAAFAREVLGLPMRVDGGTSYFDLPDGSTLAVQQPWELDPAERTVGFLVDDVAAAASELTAAGVLVDEVAESPTQRYVHFRAPDGQLYELVQDL